MIRKNQKMYIFICFDGQIFLWLPEGDWQTSGYRHVIFKVVDFSLLLRENDQLRTPDMSTYKIASTLCSQCDPDFSNQNQRVHGLFHFYVAGIYKKDQNELKKASVIRLPEFTSINLAEKYY